MRFLPAAPSPGLLKYVFGRHVLNGFAVALGVLATALAVGGALGFAAGMTAATGALCVSIGDQPMPFAAKARILPLAFVCAVLSVAALALTLESSLAAGCVVVIVGAGAGLLLAWGRWAIPLSMVVMLAMVFTLGAPESDFAERLHYLELFALGGASYIPIALALTAAFDASGRRLTFAEALREFAAYLRCVAGFFRETPDVGAQYLRLVEQQASLAEHLQAARALIAGAGDRASALRLTGGIVMLLEALDGMVSIHADQAPLRLAAEDNVVARRVSLLILRLAKELERLALDLTLGKERLEFPDHRETFDILSADITEIARAPGADPHLVRAALLTRNRMGWAVDHLARLPAVLTDSDAARKALAGVDLKKFVPPLSASPRTLLREIRLSSPIFRHALRLAAALGAGYALIELVPQLKHGNWILLTTAVIMRASYSVTRQRRNDRLLGSLLGCAIAGALLATRSPLLLFGAQLTAIGVAHAYARVDYRVTSTAASIMALLTMHLLNPAEAAPVAARLVDTVIGAGLAFLFNMLLPHWERQGAPAIARSFLKNLRHYADRALRFEADEQDYRLARKQLIDAMAALSESAQRMRGEPEAERKLWPDYGRLIASAYTTAAQIVTVRLMIRLRRDALDPGATEALLEETRRAVVAELDLSQPQAERPSPEAPPQDEWDAATTLRQRCAEVLREAAHLRALAQTWAGA